MNQRVASELLMAQGAEVEVASGGISGSQKVLAADPPFDAVLMDIQMPDMDGYDTTRVLRRDPGMASMPIIAMTANVMATDKALCLQAGMTDHIGKPLNLQLMIATILKYCKPGSDVTGLDVLSEERLSYAPQRAPQPSFQPSSHSLADSHAYAEPTELMDVPAALVRLGGDRQLLSSIAVKFDDEARAALADLHAHLIRSELSAAANVLHAFRGTAGMIGATALQQYLGALESAMRNAAADHKFDEQLATLVDLVARSSKAIASAFPPEKIAAETMPALPAAQTPEKMLGSIAELLEQSNMRALSTFAQYEKQYCHAGIATLCNAASSAMARLDFKAALQLIRQLQTSRS